MFSAAAHLTTAARAALQGGRNLDHISPVTRAADNAALPATIIKGCAAGRVEDNQFFTRSVDYIAPGGAGQRGTGQTYRVHQTDIDSDLVTTNPITGVSETNREIMQRGGTPFVVREGETVQLNLHHSRQDARGSLFEVSEPTHRARTGQGREALHPFDTNRGQALNGPGGGPSGRSNPDYPVLDRSQNFDVDRRIYWQERIREIDNIPSPSRISPRNPGQRTTDTNGSQSSGYRASSSGDE